MIRSRAAVAMAAVLSLAPIAAPAAAAAPSAGAAPASASAPSAPKVWRPSGPVPPPRHASIEWRTWSRAAFDEARRTKRLVVVDLTASWCHWCRIMEEQALRDSMVIGEIRTSYVPIRVDSDLRPDIADRYLSHGWPTIAVLSADGHLLSAKTYAPAQELLRFLLETVRFYRTNRAQVDLKVAEAARGVVHTWDSDTLSSDVEPAEYVDRAIESLRGIEDKTNGGFGISPKTARWDAISFLLRAADAKRDDGLRALAVRAAAAAFALQDSVDHGFFRAALEPDWTRVRYDKLLEEQAAARGVLLRAWRATGEQRFLEAADGIRDLVMARFWNGPKPAVRGPRTGTRDRSPWLTSALAADARTADGTWLDGEVYYRLSREARRKQPPPPASPVMRTDAAAHMASTLLAGPRSDARAPSAARAAMAIVNALWSTMRAPSGAFYHARADTMRAAEGLLGDQAAFGNAMLDAYAASGDDAWLVRADSLAQWIRRNLEDPVGGGFRYAPRDTGAVGRLAAGDKPEAQNTETALFFLRLHWITGRAEDRVTAERAATYLTGSATANAEAAPAELLLQLEEDPVRLAVVGDPARTSTLREAARSAPASEVVVVTVPRPSARPGLFWPDGLPSHAVAPAVYRWTATGWRGPVVDPSKIGDLLDRPTAGP